MRDDPTELTPQQLREENERLRERLAKAEDALRTVDGGDGGTIAAWGEPGGRLFSATGSEQVHRLIVETMREAAITLALDGTVLFCNPRFCEFVGLGPSEIVGHGLAEFVVPGQREAVATLIARSQNEPVRQRLVFQGPADQTVPAHVSATVLGLPGGVNISVVATDWSELEASTQMLREMRYQREALRQSEERLRVILTSIGDAVIAADTDGLITFLNPVAAVLTGWIFEDAVGQRLQDVLRVVNEETHQPSEDLVGRVLAEARVIETNHSALVTREGREIPVENSVAPILDSAGNVTGVVVVFQDVTEKRRAQEAILRHSATLEGINAVLAAALTCPTERELGNACLEIAAGLTQSRFGLVGDTNEQGLEDIAISNPGWDACDLVARGHGPTVSGLQMHGIYGRVLTEGKSLITNDPGSHPDRVGVPVGHPPLESFLGAPLVREGRTIGMIAVANRPGGYTPVEQETLEALAPAVVEAFQRKRAEESIRESETRFRSLFENALDAMFLTVPDGKVLAANPAACAMFGMSEEELRLAGRSGVANLADPRLAAALAERERMGRISAELTYIRKDGTIFPAEVQSVTLANRGKQSFVVIRDITERRRAEEELRRAVERADESARHAQQARDAQERFLRNMSHEVRTPLNAVLGLTDILLKTRLDEKQRRYVELARLSAKSMGSIIGDILDFSKIEAGKIELESVAFAPSLCAEEVAAMLAQEAAERQLTLCAAPASPAVLLGDPTRYRQVLFNLIGNALKFTPSGGRVTVELALEEFSGASGTATASRPATALLVTKVRDTGIGIAPDQVAGLFEPFTQADATTTRRFGGTGLGLSICKGLVALMGGDITVESELGRGTCFTVQIPLLRSEAGTEPARDGAEEAGEPEEVLRNSERRVRLLLAEDNEVNRIVVEGILEGLPVEIATAETGRQALLLASEKQFDLILMDVQMPEMDGYEATGAIREVEKLSQAPRTPIVALTAHVSAGDTKRCLEAGMDGYLAKPVSGDSLLAAVVRWGLRREE